MSWGAQKTATISGRFDGVQALRFIAAAMVVVTHVTFYTHERLDPTFTVWSNGTRGVEIFFVISGFVMITSSRHYAGGIADAYDFFLRRVERVVPLYWLATTLKIIALVLFPSAVLHASLSADTIFKSYFFIPSRNFDGNVEPILGVGWTLIFEMFFYLVFSISLTTRNNIYYVVAPALLICACGQAFRPTMYPAWMFYFNTMVLDFLAGMIIGSATLNGIRLPSKLALPVGFIAFAYTMLSNRAFNLPRIIEVDLPAAIVVIATVSLEPNLRGRLPKVLLFLGSASYAIYLFHPLVAPIGPTIVYKIGSGSAYIGVCIGWISGVSAGCLVFYFLEPILKKAARRVATSLETLWVFRPKSK